MRKLIENYVQAKKKSEEALKLYNETKNEANDLYNDMRKYFEEESQKNKWNFLITIDGEIYLVSIGRKNNMVTKIIVKQVDFYDKKE